jgi:DNA invertase Pin-like site-specific DNA recombinase
MANPSRVAGYFRVSQAREGMSAPELDEDEIRRYCRYRQVDLAEVFCDIDYSGFRGAKPRPRLEELKARKHEFSLIVVPKLSRFGRSLCSSEPQSGILSHPSAKVHSARRGLN